MLALVGLALWFSGAGADAIDAALGWGREVIARHAVSGMAVFVLLAALSAMLAFFSSALLVPVAVAAWGTLATLTLLWLGWIAGGLAAYTLARTLGRPVVARLASAERLAYFEGRIGARARWWMILLLQLGVPSEIPGYLCGTIRYPFAGYLAALALGELPYAVGAVYLGESFVQRNAILFVAVLLAGAILLAASWRILRRRIG